MRWVRASAAATVLCVVLLLEIPASGFNTSRSTARILRNVNTKAKMYAQPITSLEGATQIQVYKKLCNGADRARLCLPTSAALRAAVTRTADRGGVQITWVDTPTQDGSDFWVLSQIRFHQRDAAFRFHYEETTMAGCVSDGGRRFRWSKGAWRLKGGSSSTGCP